MGPLFIRHPHLVVRLRLGQHQSPSSSSTFQARESSTSLPQVHLPIVSPVRSDHHLPTCVDNSRRCALAHCSRSNIGCHWFLDLSEPVKSVAGTQPSNLLPKHCRHWRLSCILFLPPSSLLPTDHPPTPFPRCHIPDTLVPSLSDPLPALYPFHAIAHTSSCDMTWFASGSSCAVVASCVPTFPRSIGIGPSPGTTPLMATSNSSMISSKFLGPELSLDVHRDHLPHHERFLRVVDHFELMLMFRHFQWPNSDSLLQVSLHLLGTASVGCSATAGSFDDLGA